LWAFYFLVTDRRWLLALSAVLAVACKEDVALVVAMMGVYALVVQRRPGLGVPTLVLGLAWYFLAVGVWQPHVSGGVDKQGWRYEQLAWPLPALVRTLLTEPGRWIPYALQPAKRAYLLGLLWPWGFLPLLAPQVSLIALPPLLVNLLSSFAAQHEPDVYQYNAAIAPFLALGAASAVGWLARWAGGGRRRLLVGLAVALLIGGGLSFHFLYGHTPLAAAFRPPEVTDHHAVRERLLREVPADAAISAQTTLVPHVSGRAAVWEYPMGLEVADTVMLDVTAPHTTILLTADYYASIEALTAGGWGLETAEDGYLLFRRGAPGMGELPEGFYRYALATGPGDAAIDPIDFGPVRLVGVEVTAKREGWVDLTLTWQADEPVPAGYRPSIALGHSGGALTAWHRQDLPFGWGARGWATGEVIRLTTGVGTGHGPSAGWGTGWTLYAGAIDDGSGVWLEPTGVATRGEAIDGHEAHLVPVVEFENTWGVLHAFRITGG
jgi:hypothetical protein